MKRVLTETESMAIVSALHVAAEVYRKDKEVVAKEFGPNGRTVKQFELQAIEAKRLAEELDGYLVALEY